MNTKLENLEFPYTGEHSPRSNSYNSNKSYESAEYLSPRFNRFPYEKKAKNPIVPSFKYNTKTKSLRPKNKSINNSRNISRNNEKVVKVNNILTTMNKNELMSMNRKNANNKTRNILSKINQRLNNAYGKTSATRKNRK